MNAPESPAPAAAPHGGAAADFAASAESAPDLLLHGRYLAPARAAELAEFARFLADARRIARDADPAEAARRLATTEQSLAATPGPAGVQARHILQALQRELAEPRCRTWSDLMLQARFAAMPLGRLLLVLHDEPDPRAAAPADALSGALFLLGRIAACGTEARTTGRSLLPEAWLREAQGEPAMLAEARATPAVRATIARLLERAGPMLEQARALPGLTADPDLRRHLALAGAIAERLARRLARADPLAGPIRLPPWDRARAEFTARWRARRGPARALDTRAP
ncbi:MAG: squalene/phytoene synthase family protein [Alphaproteobacteria bacterium]|nr:squalene/phytoene synthase family protein [Alphaproteobacteria bacterium]